MQALTSGWKSIWVSLYGRTLRGCSMDCCALRSSQRDEREGSWQVCLLGGIFLAAQLSTLSWPHLDAAGLLAAATGTCV